MITLFSSEDSQSPPEKKSEAAAAEVFEPANASQQLSELYEEFEGLKKMKQELSKCLSVLNEFVTNLKVDEAAHCEQTVSQFNVAAKLIISISERVDGLHCKFNEKCLEDGVWRTFINLSCGIRESTKAAVENFTQLKNEASRQCEGGGGGGKVSQLLSCLTGLEGFFYTHLTSYTTLYANYEVVYSDNIEKNLELQSKVVDNEDDKTGDA